jgi:O-acetyl-ADP-ribose deacetylase (regulator of RNase III)
MVVPRDRIFMKWTVRQGDILDVSADVLVCSANPYLNLSGGVGGALLMRYGVDLQATLHEYLQSRNTNFALRGTMVETGPCGTPYRAILHAVALDSFYESTIEIVQDLVHRCLLRSMELEAKIVSLTALATGYGRLTIGDFGKAIQKIRSNPYAPIEEVVITVRHDDEANELAGMIGI